MLYIVKKTLDTIVNTGNHYVVAIKRNARTLYGIISVLVSVLTQCRYYFKKEEKSRGRLETRCIHIFEATEAIKEYLPHIKTVARVHRKRKTKKGISSEIIYYISDLDLNAKQFYKGIRGHWSIENRLHWVKDVIMHEDSSQIKNKRIAPLMSILRSYIIMSAYQNSNSVINFQRTIAHNVVRMSLLLE